jgi:F-type H+-transporting ATPase subunit a
VRKQATIFLIGVFVICPILLLVGLISGAIGSSVVGNIGLPDWLSVSRPHPKLPAEVVFHILDFPITNTIIGAWISIIVLVGVSYIVTHKMKIIPSRLQNIFEVALEGLLNFCTNMAGEKNGRRFFPVVATIFLFVIVNAWLSLLPGFHSITINNAEGEVVPLLRGANTDINMAMALAMTYFVFVGYYGLKTLNSSYLKLNVGSSDPFTGFINILINMLDIVFGVLHILSFTMRLFGNMIAGEILLMVVFFLVHLIAIFPFYGLELLVGFIQALIFGGLTLIFATMAVGHEESEAH